MALDDTALHTTSHHHTTADSSRPEDPGHSEVAIAPGASTAPEAQEGTEAVKKADRPPVGNQGLRFTIAALAAVTWLTAFSLSSTRLGYMFAGDCVISFENKSVERFRETSAVCDASFWLNVLIGGTLSLHFNGQGAIACVAIIQHRQRWVATVMTICCGVIFGLTALALSISLGMDLPFWSCTFPAACLCGVSFVEAALYFGFMKSLPLKLPEEFEKEAREAAALAEYEAAAAAEAVEMAATPGTASAASEREAGGANYGSTETE